MTTYVNVQRGWLTLPGLFGTSRSNFFRETSDLIVLNDMVYELI